MSRRPSIETRVQLLAVIPALLVAVGVTVMSAASRLQDLSLNLDERGHAATERVAHAAEWPLWVQDLPVLQDLVDDAVRDPDVTLAHIENAQGEVLVSARVAPSAVHAQPSAHDLSFEQTILSPPATETDGLRELYFPQAQGKLRLHLSPDRLRRERNRILGLSLFTLLLGAGGTVALGMTMSRRTMAPIEALRQAQQAAEQAHQSQVQFLAYASHDIRQPAQAIAWLSADIDQQIRGWPDTPRSLTHSVDILRQSCAQLGELVDGLLDDARLEAGQIHPVWQAVPLRPLCRALEAELRPMARTKGLQWVVQVHDVHVLTDPMLFTRVVRNLVVNALQHTPDGTVMLVSRRSGEGGIRLQVRDTGPGMSAADQDRVFLPFVQLKPPSDQEPRTGTGLGLSIVARLCEVLRLDLHLRSAPGQGSTFTVRVPLA